jgi:glycosyltransferase involved in cell wall biosynthesis
MIEINLLNRLFSEGDKNIKKTVNIYINARFISRPVTGVERYAIELVKAIDELIEQGILKGYQFILIAPKHIKADLKLKNIKLKQVGLFKGHLWEQTDLPFAVKNSFLLNLCNTGPAFKRNQLVTIHDASVYTFPQAYSLFFRTWYKMIFKLLAIFSKRIITVSLFSLNELVKYCKISPSKIYYIHEGKEHILYFAREPEILERLDLQKRPYVLAVSSFNPNKNFESIIRAIKIIGEADFDIVIAGGINSKVFRHSNLSMPLHVKVTGYVSDSELKTLYENAHCFIYPSFYEGFGLPPLEAMACGCPVIVSNTASLPEVCENAALYCDPYDPADIAAKIKQVMNEPDLRNKLRELGLSRAGELSWDKSAEALIKQINEIINK